MSLYLTQTGIGVNCETMYHFWSKLSVFTFKLIYTDFMVVLEIINVNMAFTTFSGFPEILRYTIKNRFTFEMSTNFNISSMTSNKGHPLLALNCKNGRRTLLPFSRTLVHNKGHRVHKISRSVRSSPILRYQNHFPYKLIRLKMYSSSSVLSRTYMRSYNSLFTIFESAEKLWSIFLVSKARKQFCPCYVWL